MDNITSNEDLRKAVFEAVGVSVEEADKRLRSLKKLLKKEKRLPEVPSIYMLEMFLIMNKFDIDTTQKKIEMYYQVRTEIPEIFHNKNPSLPHMQKTADVVYLLTLPKLTEKLYRVNIMKLKDTNPSNLNSYNFAAYMFNYLELNFVSGKYAAGELYIYDLEGASLRHMFNFGMNVTRKLSRVLQEVYSTRMKGVHFINCPIFIDAILAVARAVMKKKLVDRIHVHKTNETLKEYIPEYILPKEYGGQEDSLDKLREIQKKQFVEYSDRFNKLDSLAKYKSTSKGGKK